MALKNPGELFGTAKKVPVKPAENLGENVNNIKEEFNKVEEIRKQLNDVSRKQLNDASNFLNNSLTEIVDKNLNFLSNEYSDQLDKFNSKINSLREEINSKVDGITCKVDGLEKNNQYLKSEIQVVEQRQQTINLSRIKKEVFEGVENILSGDVTDNIKRLEEKIEVVRESYQQTLNEGLLNIPPNVKNSDPLTPLDQNFVTLAQLNDHYRLFLNRIQVQLATLGGGGAVELQYLDDVNVGIATNITAYDGYYLQVDLSQTGDDENKKFKFAPLSVAGVATFNGPIDANSNIDVAGVSTLSGNIESNGKLTINPDDGSTTWQRELTTIHQIRDDIYLQSTLNVGDKAGFDFTPLDISAFSYSGTTLTLTTAAQAIKVGANVLIKDSASGFSEAFNTISGTTGTTIKVTRSSDPSSSLSTANTKVTVYTPVDPRGCINVAKDHDKFDENSFNPILRGFVGRDLDTAAGVNTEAFKLELKKDSSAPDHVATLLHSTREFGAGQRIALTIDDGESYPDGKNLVLTQGGVKITADDSAFTDSDELLEVEGNTKIDGTLNVGGDITVGTSQAQGVVLTSPNGTQYRLVVANDGTLSTSAV